MDCHGDVGELLSSIITRSILNSRIHTDFSGQTLELFLPFHL